MDIDELRQWPARRDVTIQPPEVDEFDLDLRLGELSAYGGLSWLGMPFAAQTDAPCDRPTGGRGAGTTCNTGDNTCPATCAGLDTCPNTQCQTCQTCATCQTCRTRCDTCPWTRCDNVCETFNPHVHTCRDPCHEP
jgi:hypothetical protein